MKLLIQLSNKWNDYALTVATVSVMLYCAWYATANIYAVVGAGTLLVTHILVKFMMGYKAGIQMGTQMGINIGISVMDQLASELIGNEEENND